jgi:hypothetical protein
MNRREDVTKGIRVHEKHQLLPPTDLPAMGGGRQGGFQFASLELHLQLGRFKSVMPPCFCTDVPAESCYFPLCGKTGHCRTQL